MGAFCIFPGVYSLKRKINISMGDLIIVKHTRAGASACACERVFLGAASIICMSGANIYHHHHGAAKRLGRQVPPTLSGERRGTLSNLCCSNVS